MYWIFNFLKKKNKVDVVQQELEQEASRILRSHSTDAFRLLNEIKACYNECYTLAYDRENEDIGDDEGLKNVYFSCLFSSEFSVRCSVPLQNLFKKVNRDYEREKGRIECMTK